VPDNNKIMEKESLLPKDKNLKSVIALDHNFHIYIHGKHEYITKHWDEEKQMFYYKIYFKEER
jgi:hypothetical protein